MYVPTVTIQPATEHSVQARTLLNTAKSYSFYRTDMQIAQCSDARSVPHTVALYFKWLRSLVSGPANRMIMSVQTEQK